MTWVEGRSEGESALRGLGCWGVEDGAAHVLNVDKTEPAVYGYHLEGLEEAWRNRQAASLESRGSKR